MYAVGVALNHFEIGLQTAFFERGALTFNIVDRIADNELRAQSRWGGRILVVVRPLFQWRVEEGRTEGAVIPWRAGAAPASTKRRT